MFIWNYLKEYFYFVYGFKLASGISHWWRIDMMRVYVVARRGQGMPRSDFHQRVRVASHRAQVTSVILTGCVNSDEGCFTGTDAHARSFHVSSPLIWEECAGRSHDKVLQTFKPANPVPHHCAPLRCPQTISYCRYFPHPQSLICLYFLFISLSHDRCLHQSQQTWTSTCCWHCWSHVPHQSWPFLDKVTVLPCRSSRHSVAVWVKSIRWQMWLRTKLSDDAVGDTILQPSDMASHEHGVWRRCVTAEWVKSRLPFTLVFVEHTEESLTWAFTGPSLGSVNVF